MSLTRRSFVRKSLGAGLAAAGLRTRLRALPPRPKLFILIVAEQFRTDYFDSHPNAFSRLLGDSAYFPNCYLDSVSFTATGLATIATGAYGSTHGIVAERWFEKSLVEANADLLQATTLAAQVRAADARNRVYGIGLEERTTRILTGSPPYTGANTGALKPDAALRYEWVAAGRESGPPMRILDPAKAAEFPLLWNASPPAQAAEFRFARELVSGERLGKSEGLDLLCVVLNSLGSIALENGANSPLVFDLVSHLDREMEAFLRFLDDTVGPGFHQLCFTGAHGSPDSATRRVASRDIAAAVEKVAPVAGYVYPFLTLRSGDAAAAAKASGAAAWYTASGRCSHSGLPRRRLENSFHATRSGDAILAYAPGEVEDFANGRGVSSGSIYNYDTRVPLLLFGPQFEAGEFEDRVELTDIAPTLARALGVAVPSSSSGRVLSGAFAGGSRRRQAAG